MYLSNINRDSIESIEDLSENKDLHEISSFTGSLQDSRNKLPESFRSSKLAEK